MTPRPTRVVVVGQGYVGLPLAMRAVEAGHDVIGLDVDDRHGSSGWPPASRSSRTCRRRCSRPALRERAATAPPTTPTDVRGLRRRGDHGADAAARRRARPVLHRGRRRRRSARYVRPGALVVLESTTYPGTTEELRRADPRGRLAACAPARDFAVGYSPERIDPGNRDVAPARPRRRWCPASTPASLRRASTRSTARSSSRPCRSSSHPGRPSWPSCWRTRSATSTSRWSTSWRCSPHDLDIDVWEAIDAAATKPFGFMRFTPGPGRRRALPADRPELPVVARAAAARAGRSGSSSWPTTSTTTCPTTSSPRLMRRAEQARASRCRGPRVLVLGLAYKRNSGDARESPAVALVAPAARRRGRGRRGRPARGRAASPTDALTRRVALDRAGADAGRRGRAGDRPRRLRLRPGDRARSPACWTPGTGWTAPMSSSSSRPSIAVVLSGWPRVSESFALNEVLALHRAGLLAAVLRAEDRRRRDPAPGRGAARADGRDPPARRRRRPGRGGGQPARRHRRLGRARLLRARPGRGRRGGRRQVRRPVRVQRARAGRPQGVQAGARRPGPARRRRGDLQRGRRRRGRGRGHPPDAGPARRRPGRLPGHAAAGRPSTTRSSCSRSAGWWRRRASTSCSRRCPGWTGRTGCGWSATARCGPGWRR